MDDVCEQLWKVIYAFNIAKSAMEAMEDRVDDYLPRPMSYEIDTLVASRDWVWDIGKRLFPASFKD